MYLGLGILCCFCTILSLAPSYYLFDKALKTDKNPGIDLGILSVLFSFTLITALFVLIYYLEPDFLITAAIVVLLVFFLVWGHGAFRALRASTVSQENLERKGGRGQ